MRYRFAGNVDVPEWILSEVGTLSKISCVRLKLITRQLIAQLAGGTLDVEKVTKLVGEKAGFTWSDIKAALAAISFILRGAVRFDVDEGAFAAPFPPPLLLSPSIPTPLLSPPFLTVVLNAELQQLGLPKENSDGVSRPYRIHRERLRAQAVLDSLRAPRLVSLDWRVDAVVATSALGSLRREGGLGEPVATLRLGLSRKEGAMPQRTPVAAAGATPLLLAARAAASARSGGAGADAAAGDAALLALGAAPADAVLGAGGVEGASGGSGGGGSGGGGGGVLGGGGAAAASAGSAGAAAALVAPAAFVEFSLAGGAFSAFVAEMRVATEALRRTAAALAAPS
jgi:hypothetical protein